MSRRRAGAIADPRGDPDIRFAEDEEELDDVEDVVAAIEEQDNYQALARAAPASERQALEAPLLPERGFEAVHPNWQWHPADNYVPEFYRADGRKAPPRGPDHRTRTWSQWDIWFNTNIAGNYNELRYLVEQTVHRLFSPPNVSQFMQAQTIGMRDNSISAYDIAGDRFDNQRVLHHEYGLVLEVGNRFGRMHGWITYRVLHDSAFRLNGDVFSQLWNQEWNAVLANISTDGRTPSGRAASELRRRNNTRLKMQITGSNPFRTDLGSYEYRWKEQHGGGRFGPGRWSRLPLEAGDRYGRPLYSGSSEPEYLGKAERVIPNPATAPDPYGGNS
jgi:hypothetical protein